MRMPATISPTTAGMPMRSATSAASLGGDEDDQDVAEDLGDVHAASGQSGWGAHRGGHGASRARPVVATDGAGSDGSGSVVRQAARAEPTSCRSPTSGSERSMANSNSG